MTIFSATIKGYKVFGSSSTGVVTMNDAGNFGFYENDPRPYAPQGGRRTLAIEGVVEALNFKPYDWGNGVEIKKGRAL